MKRISNKTDLSGMDCHLHSRFSPDACNAGADEPQKIADAVRARGLRGFIVTDHIDVGHWKDCASINFDKYFGAWERVRADNPDLTVYIGLEVGFERRTAKETSKLVADLPLEYVINSVHYWGQPHTDNFARGKVEAYTAYLNDVLASLDAPYEFNTVGHLGFPERYAPYPACDRAMEYEQFRTLADLIITRAVERGAMFELNTNSGGEMRLPRERFLREYKKAGGVRPPLGSDAHTSAAIGQYFDVATAFLDDIFGK